MTFRYRAMSSVENAAKILKHNGFEEVQVAKE